MDRGPMALFGAIVAVGLGPAMWLGAHFSDVGATPSKPPAVTSEHQAGPSPTQDAGQGAGSAPQDPSIVLDTQPRSNNDKPLRRGSSASPSASPSAKPGPSTSPSDGTVGPDPSDEQSTPPTESTTDPSGGGEGGDPGTGGGGDEPPAPPDTDSGGSGGTSYVQAPSV
jgi:hypothetical protein